MAFDVRRDGLRYLVRNGRTGLGVMFDAEKAAKRLLAFLVANAPSVTNDAALDAWFDARTASSTPNITSVTREIFKALFTVVPAGAPDPF